MKIDTNLLDQLLPFVVKPARYTGGELNSIVKDWGEDSSSVRPLRVALAFPDLYDIGMSNLALQIIYGLLNAQESVLCERVFAPWPDLEALLREHKLPLYTLESKRALADFDAIGFSLSYELCYTNVLNMLDLAGIPVLSSERDDSHPLIFAGGHAAFNPAPMSDFIDFFIIGEVEDVMLEIIETLHRSVCTISKIEILAALSKIEGVYVPSLNNPTKRRMVADLDKAFFPTAPLVPLLDTVHNRAVIEVMRGCPHRCKFCQAGYITLPKRDRSLALLLDQARELLRNTGYEEIGLLSLSTGDYAHMEELIVELERLSRKKHVSLSLPSLRVDKLNQNMLNIVQKSGHSSVTLAPEAGTQRLRDVVQKDITEDDIILALQKAKKSGAKSAKLYFMIGLPTETDEDIKGIVDLVHRHKNIMPLTVSVSTFVPKPHTPFQWDKQINLGEIREIHDYFKSKIKGYNLKFRWHEPYQSILEGVFSRGDRALGSIIHKAWLAGCKFDGWNEYFSWEKWSAILGCNDQVEGESKPARLDEYYLRERAEAEVLPWEMLDMGTSKARLWQERNTDV